MTLAALDPSSTESPVALAKAAKLGKDAQDMAGRARNLHQLLGELCTARLQVDAARLLMRALPRRYAVAWVYECYIQDAEKAPFAGSDLECLHLVERWIADGSEASRQAAGDRAAAGGRNTGPEWLASAVGWSGGSLAPRGYTVVPPADHVTADACFGALCLLAAREPKAFGVRLDGWLQRAIKVFVPAQGAGDPTKGAT